MKNFIISSFIIVLLTACGSFPKVSKQPAKEENLARNKFGIEVANLSNEIKKQSGLSHGVLITKIYSFYPANKAGLKKDDVIISIDKHNIITLEEFNTILKNYKYVYGQVTLGISRNNQLQKIKVYLD